MSESKPYADHENKRIVFLTDEEAADRDDVELIEFEPESEPPKDE